MIELPEHHARRPARQDGRAGASAVEYGLLVAGIAALIVAVASCSARSARCSTRSPSAELTTRSPAEGRCRATPRSPASDMLDRLQRRCARSAHHELPTDERGATAVEYGLTDRRSSP